ncbi:MAG TPA: hypothetical protein VD970_17030, partial [Acetobacteraceae bacterium]|nr:hypothetical protein [Acetobacteraceae bacterium]
MTLNDIPSLERRLLGLFGIVALAVIVTFLAFSWLRHRSDLQGQAALFERTTDAAALGLRVVASRAEQAVATLAATLPASGDCQAQVAATASTLPAPVISLAVQEAGGTIRCATEDGLARLVLTRVGATNPDGGAGVTWTIIPGDGTVPAVLVVGRGMRRENGGAGVVLAVLGAAGLQQVITPFYEDPKPRAWIADARGATIPALNGEAGEHAVARRPIIGGLDLVAVPPSLPILDVLRDFLLRLGLVVAVLAAGFLMLRHFWRQHVDTPMMRLEGILASQDETQLREFLDASDTPLRGVAVAASASRAKLRRRLAMRDLLLR